MHSNVAKFRQNLLLQLSLQMSRSFCLLTMTIMMAKKVLCQTVCGGTATSWTTIRSISCLCAWCVGSYSTPTALRGLGSTSTRPTRTLWPWTQGRNNESWRPGTSRCPSGNASSAASSSSIAGLWQVQYDIAWHTVARRNERKTHFDHQALLAKLAIKIDCGGRRKRTYNNTFLSPFKVEFCTYFHVVLLLVVTKIQSVTPVLSAFRPGVRIWWHMHLITCTYLNLTCRC